MAGGYVPNPKQMFNSYVLNGIQYVYGAYDVTSVASPMTRIQNFISNLDTKNLITVFDVVIYGSGRFSFKGYIYESKNYGAGTWYDYDEVRHWKRNNNVDSIT